MHKQLTVPTQIDIVDYMLNEFHEIPLLDRSLSKDTLSESEKRMVSMHEYEIEDEDELLGRQVENADHFEIHH